MMFNEAPKNPPLDVLRNAITGKYVVRCMNPRDTAAEHAKKVLKLDNQFRLDCARKFYLCSVDQEEDPLGPIYEKGIHLANLAHEEIVPEKIGLKFVERWHRFSYLAWEAYHIDVNEYPLAITKEVEL